MGVWWMNDNSVDILRQRQDADSCCCIVQWACCMMANVPTKGAGTEFVARSNGMGRWDFEQPGEACVE